jgi:hypothetical protein
MKSLTKRIKKQQHSNPTDSLTTLDGYIEVRQSIGSKVQHLYIYRNPRFNSLSADPASIAVHPVNWRGGVLNEEEEFVLNARVHEIFEEFLEEPDFGRNEIKTLAEINGCCQIDILGEPVGYGEGRLDQVLNWTFCGSLADNAPDNIGHSDIDHSIKLHLNMDGIYTDSESGMFWAYTNDEREAELNGFLLAYWPDLDFSTTPFNDDGEQSKEVSV